MKRQPDRKPGKAPSQDLIAEMMLAKTMLEEKSELLERKDQAIRELLSGQRRLEQELDEARTELQKLRASQAGACEAAAQEERREVMAEVLLLASDQADREPAAEAGLASRLIGLFKQKYGLEVIDGTPERIDPKIHRVIEVIRGAAAHGPSLQVLSKGYRVGGTVIRPALVKAVQRSATEA